MTFQGKTALVTGASRGIGRAIAREFAAGGARVAVHYRRDRSAAEDTVQQLPGQGHVLASCDLSEPGAARTLLEASAADLGGLDILVNNAGLYRPHPCETTDYETWEAAWELTLRTNLVGPAMLCNGAVRHMLERGGGRIVNVTSRGAFRGEPEAPAYGASKAGLNALSQSLAKALAPHKIFVYAIAPGWVDTDMAAPWLCGAEGDAIREQSPLGRVASVEEVARTVAFLAGDAPESLTGAIVDLNGASYLR